MLSPAEYDHYNRQILLEEFGESGQQKLKNASVLIVGVGGLGCPVSQYLAAAGVGRIGLVDYDKVTVSNLHRQILFTYDDVGKNKASVAKTKLTSSNPFIKIDDFDRPFDSENCLAHARNYDLVMDCSDNFNTKYLINDTCVLLNKPWIGGSLFKFQGQVSVFNYKGGPTYRCLFPSPGELENCSETGVIGVLPGVIGSIMAGEAIKMFGGIEPALSGKLLIFNFLNLKFRYYNFELYEPNKIIKKVEDYSLCTPKSLVEIDQILGEDLLIDVRSPKEHAMKNIGGINITIDEIENNILAIKKMQKGNQRIIFYCKSGTRSNKAVSLLLKKNIPNVFSVKGGIG